MIAISDTTVTVTWSSPMQRNGIIIGYEVMYSLYEDYVAIITVFVASNVSSFTITNLGKL